ncbi:MAG: two-component system phosphate regulon sensor histidine kinase PhoR [Bacteriovoracaceae bacterium]|jgi:two-component system phosphate regulon sensor histidine kinase PhoR
MKPKKLIWKLFPTALLYLTITFICIYFVFSFFLLETFREGVFKELKEKTHYLEDPISESLVSGNLERLATEVEKLKSRGNLWITILDGKGKVISDSEVELTSESLEDNKPEVIEAMRGSDAFDLREADHNQKKTFILAHPLKSGDITYGILRVGLREDYVRSDLNKIKLRSFIIAALVSITGFFFFFWSALKVSIPLGSILKAARAISKGNLDMKVPLSMLESEEVQGLSKYVSRMGAQLKENLVKLEERESEQQAVLKAMADGVLSVNPEKKLLQVNLAMRTFMDLDPEVIFRGKSLLEVFRIPKINDFIDKILKEKSFINEEFTLGGERYFIVTGGPLYANDGKLLGAFLVFHDLTEIKTLERYRKEFVSNISHELRTPITAIQGYLETLCDGKVEDDETRDKFMGIINRQASRLGHIVEDLLKLSQIETGSLEFEWQEVRPLIHSAVDICKERAEKKGIKIEVNLEENLSAKLNQSLLQQGLVNLIDNAIKYSPENSSILISARSLEGAISIEVKDQGPGIAHEHLERLFERFYSVDKARSKELGGSGIGLAIVKHIARAHGGREAVISRPGEGSTFSIII